MNPNVVEKGLALSEQLQCVFDLIHIQKSLHMKPVSGPMTSNTATGTPNRDTIVLTKPSPPKKNNKKTKTKQKQKKNNHTARAGCILVDFLDVCYKVIKPREQRRGFFLSRQTLNSKSTFIFKTVRRNLVIK